VSDTRHLVALYLHLGRKAPEMRCPSSEELHVMWEGPGSRLPVVLGRNLGRGAPEKRLPAPLGLSLVLPSWTLHLVWLPFDLDQLLLLPGMDHLWALFGSEWSWDEA
jgi:hypothetical protein